MLDPSKELKFIILTLTAGILLMTGYFFLASTEILSNCREGVYLGVLTPARNISTGKCEIMPSSCIPNGYVADPKCDDEWQLKQQEELNKNLKEQEISNITGWQTYRNEKYGFEVKYPPYAQIEERNQYLMTGEGIAQIKFGSCYIIFGDGPSSSGEAKVNVSYETIDINNKQSKRTIFVSTNGSGFASISLNYPQNQLYPYFLIDHSIGDSCMQEINPILSTLRFFE